MGNIIPQKTPIYGNWIQIPIGKRLPTFTTLPKVGNTSTDDEKSRIYQIPMCSTLSCPINVYTTCCNPNILLWVSKQQFILPGHPSILDVIPFTAPLRWLLIERWVWTFTLYPSSTLNRRPRLAAAGRPYYRPRLSASSQIHHCQWGCAQNALSPSPLSDIYKLASYKLFSLDRKKYSTWTCSWRYILKKVVCCFDP